MKLRLTTALIALLPVWGMAGTAFAQDGTQEPSEDEGQEQYVTVQEFDEAMEELDALRAQLDVDKSGTTKFMISGSAVMFYGDPPDSDSSFAAEFAPVFLWKISDKLFYEGQLEFGLGGVTEFEYSQVSYLASDWLTLSAGEFLSPFGLFYKRFHPTWINRLPDKPLMAREVGGLVPVNQVGIQAHGGVPVGVGRANYAFWVSNGPSLKDGTANASDSGDLDFETGLDTNQNKTIGGRIGYLPFPGLEVGASGMSGKVSGETTNRSSMDFNLLGLDLSAQKEFESVGRFRFDGEFVRSKVGNAVYFPTTPAAVTFSNRKNGGYGMLSFRPTHASSDLFQNLEFALRYDWFNRPSGAPNSADETSTTWGIDYWLNASTVVKLAISRLQVDGQSTSSTFLAQVSLGF